MPRRSKPLLFVLELAAGAIHFVLVGGAFAAASGIVWVLVATGSSLCGCAEQPSYFESAGMLAFGYIVSRSVGFARRHTKGVRRKWENMPSQKQSRSYRNVKPQLDEADNVPIADESSL
jgi:hypothetical protein